MPDPQGKQTELRTLLAAYLTQETIQYFADINWSYYRLVHNSTMSPRAAIFIDRIGRKEYPYNLDSSQKSYKIHIRLLISKKAMSDALTAAEGWEEELNDVILKKLQIEGYQGLFQGIHPDPQQPSAIELDKNQDDGGMVMLHLFLYWEDNGSVTGDQMAAFL